MPGTSVDYLIDKGGWKVFFGTSWIEISKIGANLNGSMFLVDWDRV